VSDVIRLAGLRFFAVIGDLPHERTAPQPIEVDLEVTTDLSAAAESDRLAEGLDYRELYRAAADALGTDEATAPHLIEALCGRIAERVLAVPRVERVRVRCRKPWAALPGPADHVEIEVERP
jgi:dihydroneopterin aldolase